MNVSVNTPTVALPTVRGATPRIDVAALDPEAQAQVKKLDEAAKGFEQLFVQQMLKTANFGQEAASDGYGSMALEAMASSVTQGGGMGLATMIRDSLIQSQLPNLLDKG